MNTPLHMHPTVLAYTKKELSQHLDTLHKNAFKYPDGYLRLKLNDLEKEFDSRIFYSRHYKTGLKFYFRLNDQPFDPIIDPFKF